MTKEKMYLVISFLLQALVAACIYNVKQDSNAIRTEIALTRELLQIQINDVKSYQNNKNVASK